MASVPLTPEQLQNMGRAIVEIGGRLRSASKEAIETLKDVPRDGGGADPLECAICLDQAKENTNGWKEMPCGHRFHRGCLEKWLRAHDTCPMCRQQLAKPAPDITPAEWIQDARSFILLCSTVLHSESQCS